MRVGKLSKLVLVSVAALSCCLVAWTQSDGLRRRIKNVFVAELPISEVLANTTLTDREKLLISHVRTSIENAQKGVSKLNQNILKIKGMSSAKVRHLLNNLCSLPHTNYLEIGCWNGSTWIASLYGNKKAITGAVAVDNWSEFKGSEETFNKNCSRFLDAMPYRAYSSDCFSLDLNSIFQLPVNIYLYDGSHTALFQEKAFTYYNSVLDDVFIAMVDDWNWKEVRDGTHAAFDKLEYKVLYEATLPAKFCGDRRNYWNGFYVAVIRKTQTAQ